MGFPSKKRKIEGRTSRTAETVEASGVNHPSASNTHKVQSNHIVRVDHRIQQAKKSAIIQAQQEGCTANFRSFDSPYGNFLLPVIPTLSDLT